MDQAAQQGAQGFQVGPPTGFPGGPGGRPGGLRMLMLGGPWVWLLFGVTLVVLAIAFYQIYRKAGFNGLLGLLMFVPIVNLGMVLWFAFTEWPIFKKLRETEALAALHASGEIAYAPAGVPATSATPAFTSPDVSVPDPSAETT